MKRMFLLCILLGAAFSAPHTQADFEAGMKAAEEGALADAFEEWMIDAQQRGDPRSQFQLGLVFDRGLIGLQDDHEAAQWYRLAADQGHAEAQYRLGLLYYFGQGVEQNQEQALRWFQKASEQGNEDAGVFLRMMGSKCDFP